MNDFDEEMGFDFNAGLEDMEDEAEEISNEEKNSDIELNKNVNSIIEQRAAFLTDSFPDSGEEDTEEKFVALNSFHEGTLEQEHEKATEDAGSIETVAPILPTDSPEDIEKKKRLHQAWLEFLREWKEDDRKGIDVLFPKVLNVYGIAEQEERDKAIAELEAELLALLKGKDPDFTIDEVRRILSFTVSNRARYHRILLHRLFLKALKVEGGKYYNQIFVIFQDPDLPIEEKIKQFQAIITAAAKASGDKEFQALVEQEQKIRTSIGVIDTREGTQASLASLKERIIQKESFGRIQEKDLEGMTLGSLQTVSKLIEQGDTDTALFVLHTPGRTPLSNGVEVSIQDLTLRVVLEGTDIVMYLPGERRYILREDIPVESALDHASLEKTGGDNDLSVLESGKFKHYIEMITGFDPNDETIGTIKERQWVKMLFNSLLRGKGSQDEEVALLKKIKILTPSGEPSPRFIAWWALEMQHLKSLGSLEESGGTLNEEAMEALAASWDASEKFAFATREEMESLG